MVGLCIALFYDCTRKCYIGFCTPRRTVMGSKNKTAGPLMDMYGISNATVSMKNPTRGCSLLRWATFAVATSHDESPIPQMASCILLELKPKYCEVPQFGMLPIALQQGPHYIVGDLQFAKHAVARGPWPSRGMKAASNGVVLASSNKVKVDHQGGSSQEL
ncbi:hypothetical protein BC827DRAFT_653815 [Russula dissimulans]|nr:hypothetical protein BC827DRAFT_653815 [Russula dissimulans]